MAEKDSRDTLKMLENIRVDTDPSQLSKIFGHRFILAWELLDKRMARKYVFNPSGREIWAVKGDGREYQILPHAGFCDCDDFYFNVIDDRAVVCKHIIAQRLAETLCDFVVIEVEDAMYSKLMEGWRSGTRGVESSPARAQMKTDKPMTNGSIDRKRAPGTEEDE